jgi:hypothetical protein
MPDRYEHTQPGVLMIVVLLAGALVFAAAAYMNAGAARWVALIVALGFVALAWLFSSLTVMVSENHLQWYFGPGLWKYRMPLSDIAAVQIVRNGVFNGFGIRMRPGFRLYNVSGLDAVELRLTNGEVRRLGTDDTAGLAAALKS